MNDYNEIINIPHFEPKHKRASIENRVFQFAPFASLTGYGDEVLEAQRLTSRQIIMTDDTKEIINTKLQLINEYIKERPLVNILYFKKDAKKNGGEYLKYIGNLKKIDLIDKMLIFNNNFKVRIDDIIDIDMCI